MKLAGLKTISQYRQNTETFLGLNQAEVINDGEFEAMRNLSSDKYPVLSTRKKRGWIADVYNHYDVREIMGALEKNGKLYMAVRGQDNEKVLLCDGKVVMNISTGSSLVSMGAYICIFPDKLWFNTISGEYGSMESEFSFDTAKTETALTDDVSGTMMYIAPSDVSGEFTGGSYITSDTMPEDAENGMRWMDTSAGDIGEYVLKKYDEGSGMWIEQDASYAYLCWCGIHKYFSVGDCIRIEGFTNEDRLLTRELVNCEHMVVAVKENGLVITTQHPFNTVRADFKSDSPDLRVTRRVPDMDFVFECENRLWGCRYGKADGEMVNEIYACKLGDFKNWYCFEGISTDSYTMSIGSDGPFTGGVNYLGYPTFFKENCIHKIYGNMPSEYQLSTTVCRGVEEGSAGSLAVVNEVLYYKSADGICAYDGSQPVSVSSALKKKYKNAVAGSCGGKYYVSMEDTDGFHMFVYDSVHGLWHMEDDTRAYTFFNRDNDLRFVSGERIYSVNGQVTGFGTEEEDFDWEAVTGVIGYAYPDKKYLSRFTIRAGMEPGSHIRIYVEYDSSGRWEYAGEFKGMKTGTFLIPVRPKRCDHLRIKLTGNGECKIFSFTRILELGSDV